MEYQQGRVKMAPADKGVSNGSMASAERRHFTRIPFEAKVIIMYKELQFETTLIDISLNGLLVDKGPHWISLPLDHDVAIDVKLGDSEYEILFEARLRHEDTDHAGFQCHHIDLSSISHLKRLIELNLGSSDMLHRELENLGEYHWEN